MAWNDGDQAALAKLVPLIEAELHRLARSYLHKERPGHLLQTTALINEAYIRLIDWKNVRWHNRAHFFGVSAQLMRRILVDFARRGSRRKRGGDRHHVSLDEAPVVSTERWSRASRRVVWPAAILIVRVTVSNSGPWLMSTS